MNCTLYGTKAFVGGIAALALAASGCCATTATRADAGAMRKSTPLAECGAVQASPERWEIKTGSPAIRCGEVGGELVYNLGQGVTSNSRAVTLCGSSQPRALRLTCAPAAIAGRNAVGPCPTAVCQPAPETTALSQSGGQLQGTCSTLPEEQAALKPAAAPDALQLKTAVAMPTAPSPAVADTASAAVTVETVEVMEMVPAAAPAAPTEPAAATAAAPATAPVKAPELTIIPARSTILDKYNNVSKKDALTPPPNLVSSAPVAAPTEIPAPPPELLNPTAKQSAKEGFPPIPEVTDMDAAVDALLSRENTLRDTSGASSLPAVELPPNLN